MRRGPRGARTGSGRRLCWGGGGASRAPARLPHSGTGSPRASTPTCPRAAPWARRAPEPRRCSAPKASSWARWDSGRRWPPRMWLCPRCGSAAAGGGQPHPRLLPQGTVTPSGAGAGSACLPGSIPGAVSLHGGRGRGRGEVLCGVPGGLRCHSPLLAGAGGAGGPAGSLPGATGQETHARGRAPACARAPRLVVPGGGRCCAQVGAPPDSVSAARPQACARCSQRCCRPTGCASRVCRWSGAWETVLGSRPLRAPSRVPWSVMPGLLWAPSPVVA